MQKKDVDRFIMMILMPWYRGWVRNGTDYPTKEAKVLRFDHKIYRIDLYVHKKRADLTDTPKFISVLN
jgi:hypothetical protein